MLELQIMVIILLILFAVSATPIIELKYYSDLYDYADTMNKHCYNNDETRLKSLQEKDKYMWKISNYLYDFSTMTKGDNIKGNTNYMIVYQSFMQYSLGIVLFLWIFAIIYILLSFRKHIYENYYNIIILIYIIIMVIVYTVIIPIILQNIKDIYNDNIYEYLYFMKQIDLHTEKLDIAYDATSTEDIYHVKHIIFNDTHLQKIYDIPNLILKSIYNNNANDFKQGYLKFSEKGNIDEIKKKINIVTSYLIVYMIFTIPLLLMLFRTINNLYIYIYTIILIVIAVIIYYIYNLLR